MTEQARWEYLEFRGHHTELGGREATARPFTTSSFRGEIVRRDAGRRINFFLSSRLVIIVAASAVANPPHPRRLSHRQMGGIREVNPMNASLDHARESTSIMMLTWTWILQ